MLKSNLFKLKDLELVLYNKFKDKIMDMNAKRDIINASIKLIWLRIFKLKLNTETKKIEVFIININTPNILKVNFDIFDLFLNDS